MLYHCTECKKRVYKTVKMKGTEYVKAHKCLSCKKVICGEHTVSYVDENNCSITDNSLDYCKQCYKE